MIRLFRVFVLSLFLFQMTNVFILFPNKDSELEKEFNKILTVVKIHCNPDQYYLPSQVSINFDKLKEEIAYCQIRLNGFKLVFDRKFWTNYSNSVDRTQLMMHEMTHCLFNADHAADPKHFMAPFFITIPEDTLYQQFNQYLKNRCGR